MRVPRIPPMVPLVLALAAVVLAAAPGFELGARDGKARALASGQIDVEAMQREAVERGVAATADASLPIGGAECTNGFAGPYPCEKVDLEAIVHLAELRGITGSDIWGWTDPETGREIAISTMTYGMAFVDVTDPGSPQILGRVYVGWEQEDDDILWRDVKVYHDHAYLVSEHDNTNLVIFDLARLRGVTSDQGEFEPDAVSDIFGSAHNIAINEETGFAYVVGGDTCEGGLHMIDLKGDPTKPRDAGCFEEDGYTHDVQCVRYDGPDRKYHGKEICFASNEDTLTIVDVTAKPNPVLISRTPYPEAAYTHQGWLTEDHEWFLFGDELDELLGTVGSTTTYITDVSDLDAPTITPYSHPTKAIDHNLYIRDELMFQANYSSGLRILGADDASLAAADLETLGFFDVDPGPEAPVFAGAWTAYPFFESGTIVLNSFDTGLFVLSSELLPDEREDDTLPGRGAPTPLSRR